MTRSSAAGRRLMAVICCCSLLVLGLANAADSAQAGTYIVNSVCMDKRKKRNPPNKRVSECVPLGWKGLFREYIHYTVRDVYIIVVVYTDRTNI
uniref:Secreted protein n=1 Tax=Trichogramma kaykai TaxID=54128 RepID=A0ABD2XLQ6_9HYME